MKANKVLAMTLAMAMTAGMLAGCGSSEKEVKETKKVTFLVILMLKVQQFRAY